MKVSVFEHLKESTEEESKKADAGNGEGRR
jgi:hypothetical protein